MLLLLQNIRSISLKNNFIKIITFVFILASSAVVFYPQQAGAIQCDTGFSSGNDILFYNPCADRCSVANSAITVVTKLRGENNGEKVFNFWIDSGLTASQAAGITANLKDVSGLSAFRQQDDTDWPKGGWGIAQFSNDYKANPLSTSDTTGQRDAVTKRISNLVTKSTFESYYTSDYGGIVTESNGFKPDDISDDINNSFLLAELNYLTSYIRIFQPNTSAGYTAYSQAASKTIEDGTSLYEYITSLKQTGEAATAWAYLFNTPSNTSSLSTIAKERSTSASEILKLYGKGISSSCGGGLVEGGMTLEQAVEFMNVYKTSADSVNYIGGASKSCIGGPLANCVSFSAYFMNKYTELQGFKTGRGMTLVPNVAALNPDIETGTEPRPYAVFSYGKGNVDGHTGVILGVDIERGVVVVGDAGCKLSGSSAQAQVDRIHATEQPLSKYQNGQYTFIYTADILKEGVE